MAVYVGTTADRPMTASRLAATVGLPRTTVLRRLALLERAGRVERRGQAWRTPLAHHLALEQGNLAAIAALVAAAAAELAP
ncbi:helix-turn-helix domain-containing protein [Bradyrhizobium oligotrophicum]|uniref:helix-turn-helix domain-containing protein n=1 Tax=Bradyrhizobium TaxID=374 RepID=UPI003EBD7CDA